MKRIIPAKRQDGTPADFMSEIAGMEDLPVNCLLNKGVTGCGGTTVAIRSKHPYVIAMPFNSLIMDKYEWARKNGIDLAYYNGSVSLEDLKYQIDRGVTKWLVSYDSLTVLSDLLPISEYRLLVDESHLLINQANFRAEAIQGVIEVFRGYKFYTFMTATPVAEEFQYDVLNALEQVEIVWDNVHPVDIKFTAIVGDKGKKGKMDSNDYALNATVATIAKKHISGVYEGNAYFFLNSVAMAGIISSLIVKNTQGVSFSDIRFIVANTERNISKLHAKTKVKVHLSKPSDRPKKINFITSTAFEGADFLDEDGVIYLITNGSLNHTKVNIETTLPQIVGRIRNTRFANRINVFYTPNSKFGITDYDSYKRIVTDEFNLAASKVTALNKMIGEVQEGMEDILAKLIEVSEESIYLAYKTPPEFYRVEGAYKYQLSQWETVYKVYNASYEGLYSVRVNQTMHNYQMSNFTPNTAEIKASVGKKADFQSLAKLYYESFVAGDMEQCKYVANLEPILEEAQKVLGVERIKNLFYRKSDIRKALVTAKSDRSSSWKVAKYLNLQEGLWYSSEDLLPKLQKACEANGSTPPKYATKVSDYYMVAPKNKRVNGKLLSGFIIVGSKFK